MVAVGFHSGAQCCYKPTYLGTTQQSTSKGAAISKNRKIKEIMFVTPGLDYHAVL